MRYLPLTDLDRSDMLARIGVGHIDDLFADVPSPLLLKQPLDLPRRKGEIDVARALGRLASRNVAASSAPFFVGAGAYKHHVPATVDHLVQRSEFLTSYTPYQPEISQGTLQALFEFQTQVALITGMEIANASMYDGATACAEAALMACRVARRDRIVLSGGLHPHYRDVTETSARFMNLEIAALPADVSGNEDASAAIDADTSCVIVQNPDVFGRVRDYSALADACHAKGALLVVVVNEIVSLGALMSPGDMGADIVAAEGQSLGNPMSFGGPHVGLFAVREKFLRQMPGRLCGETIDADGKRGWVLTLSTREQHIRREKATSNICTNSGLCALAFTIHLTLLGEAGFTRLAEVNHAKASVLAKKLGSLKGVELLNDTFFNEFTLRLPKNATEVVDALAKRDILAGVPGGRLFPKDKGLANLLLVAATEMTTDEDMDRLANGLAEVLK